MLAITTQFQWVIQQFDVSNAFLHGTLDEEVFMEQPQDFVNPTHPDYVCTLNKVIYGLKQAPRAWFHRFPNVLKDLGFIASLVVLSLFSFHIDVVHIFLLIFVDDILVTSKNA